MLLSASVLVGPGGRLPSPLPRRRMTGLAVRAAAAVEDGPPAPQPGDYVYKDGLCLVRRERRGKESHD